MLAGCRGAECADRTWKKHLATVLTRGLQYVVEAVHIDAPRGVRLLLGHCRKQGCEMIDGADLMATHHLEHLLRLRAVEVLVDVRGRKLIRKDDRLGGD